MPLPAIDPTWINAVPYDAEELRRDLGFLLAGGTTAGVSRTGVLDPRALKVALSGSNVQITPGGCAIGTAKGAYLTGAAATATIDALTPADATNPRRDRVVLEVLDPDNGGGAGRIAQFRVITGTPSPTATAGGGYPAAPSSPAITLGHVDVPKVGNGNPTVTDLRPFTATAGAPVPVRNQADRDAPDLNFDGSYVRRLDLPGAPVEYKAGARWNGAQSTDYTPVWSGAESWGTSPTMKGRYWRSGNEVRALALVQAGASASLGLAAISFSLPPGLPVGGDFMAMGAGFWNSSGTSGALRPVVTASGPGQSSATVWTTPGTDQVKTPGNAGWPWGVGCAFHVWIEYTTDAP